MDKINANEAAQKVIEVIEEKSKNLYGDGHINYPYCAGALSMLVRYAFEKLSEKDLAELVRAHGKL